MAIKCKSCSGVYEPTLSDGARYFHACPPVASTVRVKRGLDILDIAPGQLLPGDEELARTFTERANKRDENIINGGAAKGTMKAAGSGTEKV